MSTLARIGEMLTAFRNDRTEDAVAFEDYEIGLAIELVQQLDRFSKEESRSVPRYRTRLNEQGRLEMLCPHNHRMHIGAGGGPDHHLDWYCQECIGELSTKYRSITLEEAFDLPGSGEVRELAQSLASITTRECFCAPRRLGARIVYENGGTTGHSLPCERIRAFARRWMDR